MSPRPPGGSLSLLGALGAFGCHLDASLELPGSLSARFSKQDFISKGCLTRSHQQDDFNRVSFAGFPQQAFLNSFLINVSSRRIPQQCFLRQVSSTSFPQRGLLMKVSSVKFPHRCCLSKGLFSKVFSGRFSQHWLPQQCFQNQCFSRNPCLGSHAGVICSYIVLMVFVDKCSL